MKTISIKLIGRIPEWFTGVLLCALALAPMADAATTQKTSRYEAEAAVVVNGTIDSVAVALPNNSGSSIEWTINSEHAGPGKLALVYALGGSDRPLEVKVNGQVLVASLSFVPTGDWNKFATTELLTASLNAGQNTVRVTTIGFKGPRIDCLSVIETIPLSGEIMTVFDGANLSGTSANVGQTHTVYSGGNIPVGLDNQISSFVLSEGYMAVVADPADGTNPSKVYIAADGPLTVNTLPAGLDNAISFLRVVPWIHSLKKGFCGGDDNYRAHFDHSWYYDWTKGVSRGQRATGPEYASMCWDERYVQIPDFLAQDQITHLLSFNEPDGTDQANMPVILDAVALHKELQKAGLRLGSPACREENAVGSTKWLDQFMTEADSQGVRVDYINVHWYDWGDNPGVNTNPNPAAVAQRLKTYLSNVYKRYRKPIWITEFNANPARPRSVHDGFLQEIMPYLDDLAYVERYAYYQWPAEAGKTMYFVEPSDSSLTTTGQIYNDHQSASAYLTTKVPSEWQSSDVGVAATGDTLYNGAYTIVGSGTGVSGTADGCRLVWKTIPGDATITTKVSSQIWRHNLSLSGVMIRDSLNSNSAQATMALSMGQGARFLTRASTGASVAVVGNTNIPSFPYWVRLVRKGNVFTGYHSPDGINWTQQGTPQTIVMIGDVHVGMVVTSHSDTNFNDAIFKDVSVTEKLGQSLYIDWTRRDFSRNFEDNLGGSNPDQDAFTNLQEFSFGTDPTTSQTQPMDFDADGDVTQAGPPELVNFAAEGESPDYRAVFLRRKDYLAAGLLYTVDFSADLMQWTTSSATPTLLTGSASSGGLEAVSVPFPAMVPVNGGVGEMPPTFFRVKVEMP